MTIIEGIGDDVLYLLLTLVVVIVIGLAWLSTSVSPSTFTYVVSIDSALFSNIFRRFVNLSQETDATDNDNSIPDTNNGDLVEQQGVMTDNSSTLEPSRTEGDGGASEVTEEASGENEGQSDETGTGVNPDLADDIPQSDALPSSSSAAESTTEDGKANRSGISDEQVPEGHMKIKLQFIDGNQRMVFARPEETITEFKRKNFPQELGSQATVRLIMGGKELKNEGMSLKSYNVKHGDIVHCLVLNARPLESVSHSSMASTGSRHGNAPDLGSLVFPLFGLALALVWYARIFHRGYFNGASTFSLVAITFLYVLSLIASYRMGTTNGVVGHLHQD